MTREQAGALRLNPQARAALTRLTKRYPSIPLVSMVQNSLEWVESLGDSRVDLPILAKQTAPHPHQPDVSACVCSTLRRWAWRGVGGSTGSAPPANTV